MQLRKKKWRRDRHREGSRRGWKQGEEVKDQRATNNEQWIIKARMLDNGRTIEIRADRRQWEKLRETDRVKVIYRTGDTPRDRVDAEIREN